MLRTILHVYLGQQLIILEKKISYLFYALCINIKITARMRINVQKRKAIQVFSETTGKYVHREIESRRVFLIQLARQTP